MGNLTLGEKIRNIRKGLKLNQIDFAKQLGLESATAISKYEDNSRAPDKNKLVRIAQLGNITLDALLTDVESRDDFTDKDKTADEVVKGVYESEFRVSEALTMCARVLESSTSYATALYLNIQHFDRAVTAESRMENLERNQANIESKYLDFQMSMQRKFEELEEKLMLVQTENTKLRTEINRLRATYEGNDSDGGQLVNGESGK